MLKTFIKKTEKIKENINNISDKDIIEYLKSIKYGDFDEIFIKIKDVYIILKTKISIDSEWSSIYQIDLKEYNIWLRYKKIKKIKERISNGRTSFKNKNRKKNNRTI